MNRLDLIAKVAKDADVSTAVATKVVSSVFANISSEVEAGGTLTLVGFGTFKAVKRAARAGRNPKTGEAINIPARVDVKFSAGSALKKSLNGG